LVFEAVGVGVAIPLATVVKPSVMANMLGVALLGGTAVPAPVGPNSM
jgi:hypothetical protein